MLPQTLVECGAVRLRKGGPEREVADLVHLTCLQRPGSERRGEEGEDEQGDGQMRHSETLPMAGERSSGARARRYHAGPPTHERPRGLPGAVVRANGVLAISAWP